MMKRLILTLALSLGSTTAFAADTKLNGEQITELLSGATIKGLHYGTETRQYFSESGLTLWIKSGDEKPSEARYSQRRGIRSKTISIAQAGLGCGVKKSTAASTLPMMRSRTSITSSAMTSAHRSW